jgi:hypothetical protein
LFYSCKIRQKASTLQNESNANFYLELYELGLKTKGKLLVRPEKSRSWPPQLPVSKCVYSEKFDCDDFAFAYKLWWEKNHSLISDSIWQTVISRDKKTDQTPTAHVMVIIEVDPGKVVARRYCWIEPQNNTETGCWYQDEGKLPVIPQHLLRKYSQSLGYLSSKQEWTWGSAIWVKDAFPGYDSEKGEACAFTQSPESVKIFQDQTGLNCKTM